MPEKLPVKEKRSIFEERVYHVDLNVRTRLPMPKGSRIVRVIKSGNDARPFLLVSQPIGPHKSDEAEERLIHVDPVGHAYPADLQLRLKELGQISFQDGADSTITYVVSEDKGAAVRTKKK